MEENVSHPTLATATTPESSSNNIYAYALSPSYCLLNRYSTYVLLGFTVLNTSRSNLFHGSLAALMTKTSVVAVHALVLIHAGNFRNGQQPLDLDIIGTWMLLSLTSCFLPAFLRWSATIRHSKALPIVRIWAVLIAASTIAGYVSLRKTRQLRSQSYLPEDMELYDGKGNNYLRGHELSLQLDKDRFFNKEFGNLVDILAHFILATTALGLHAALFNTHQVQKQSGPMRNFELGGSADFPKSGYSGFSDASSVGNPMRLLDILVSLFTTCMPVIFIAELVLQEMFLLKTNAIPTREGPMEIGQWGTWVAMGGVVVAALIGKATDKSKVEAQGPVRKMDDVVR